MPPHKEPASLEQLSCQVLLSILYHLTIKHDHDVTQSGQTITTKSYSIVIHRLQNQSAVYAIISDESKCNQLERLEAAKSA